MINIKEDEKLSVLNHSCAHLLAQAVKHLYPEAKFWVGPVISEGFYYDMDLGDVTLKEEDLAKIEKEMKKISKDGKRIIRHELSREEALEMFHNDLYKIDLIENMPEDERKSCCRNIETLPEVKEPSFVFTDCNMANFVFSGNSLIKAIDVERPLWGDPSFLYGVIKSRNPYLYALIGKEAESEIVDLYAKIYPYIFCG